MQYAITPERERISSVSSARLVSWCLVVALCGVGAWLWGVGSAQRPEESLAAQPPVLISPNHRVQVLAMAPVNDVPVTAKSSKYRLQGTFAVMAPVSTVQLNRRTTIEHVVPTMAEYRPAVVHGMMAE